MGAAGTPRSILSRGYVGLSAGASLVRLIERGDNSTDGDMKPASQADARTALAIA
jgi:hypothetical protein